MGYPPSVIELGCKTGPRLTTFNGSDRLLPEEAVSRQAYSDVTSTLMGLLAGAPRVARAGRGQVAVAVPAALDNSPDAAFRHFLGIFGTRLAGLYGDNASLDHLRTFIAKLHGKTIEVGDQPVWFTEQYTPPKPFTTGEPQTVKDILIILAASTARAHDKCGLIPKDRRDEYVQEVIATLGWVDGVELQLPGTWEGLMAEDAGLEPSLLRPALAQRAGVSYIWGQVGDTDLGDGVTLRSHERLYAGFMHSTDRAAVDIVWTNDDQAAFEATTASYKPFGSVFTVSLRES